MIESSQHSVEVRGNRERGQRVWLKFAANLSCGPEAADRPGGANWAL